MTSPDLSWRSLARRQWPLALILLAFLLIEVTGFSSAEPELWWQVPGSLVMIALAVLAPRRPFDAALAASATLLASSVLLKWLQVAPTPQFFVSGAVLTETAAAMAIIAFVVRQATPRRAVIGTVVVVEGMAVAEVLRSNYDLVHYGYRGSFDQYYFGGTLMLVLSVGTGLYFRARDRERSKSVELQVTEAQHAERMALARELHDVVAHYVTAIVVHSQAGQVNPQAAMQVLPVITHSGNEALTAMRRLVGTLRGSEPAGSSGANTTSDLADDVRGLAEESGQPVRLSFDLAEQVPPELGRSVLRLVQESLTNARKHGTDVSAVDVSLSTRDGNVHVLVQDNGNGQQHAPVGGSGGYGLVGMRERVELLGGTFHAGRRQPRGWEVRASLPIA
ncbi:histidine kinase [Lentzea tibetensis]|uniref:histidine kinase n=1 Tax=Lentzea tibetensis TaxID=2591470 RepID=A0A563F0N9_9PSEU|nr:histidine kinase [Lentzea tibetensis]TWP52924.1 histidine kinase [Lentzea tibetensis]